MRCHYCDGSADVTVTKGGVTVGLCEVHFAARLEDLADAEWTQEFETGIDVDSGE